MARPEIDQIRVLDDFATLYQWDVTITQPASVAFFPSIDQINFRAISSTVPKATQQPIEINMRGHKIKELGILQYDHQLTLTMYETVDNVITDWIDAWKEACWKSNTGVQKAKQDVESIVLLSRLDRQNEIIRTYELIGCFLEDYDNGGELGSESDVVKPQLILSYDYFTITR